MAFLLGDGSAGQGGRGDSDLPPMPPWTPYTPFKRPRDTPGPPLYRKGYVPLSLDRQGPYRAPYLVWIGASNQSGAGAGTHPAWPRCRDTYCSKVVLPQRPHADTPRIDRRRGAGGGISCAEGDSGPPGNGREPSWARPCEASGALFLSNGGTGGGHAACTLWPPPAPFGYFPARGKYLVRPQAGETSHKKQVSCGGKGKSLSFFFCFSGDFASAEATKGLSGRPLETFGPFAVDENCTNLQQMRTMQICNRWKLCKFVADKHCKNSFL